jgi:ATP-dependent helicase HrpA
VSGVASSLPVVLRPGVAGVPRADASLFRDRALLRVAELAFASDGVKTLPRSSADFRALLELGQPRLAGAFRFVAEALTAISTELERTLAALNRAAQHPSGKAAQTDIRSQLEQLFPADWIEGIELARLEHLPRYLRAAQTRLSRAIADPRRDAEKLAPFAPLWGEFLKKRPNASDRDLVRRLTWAFEELRVALFAPELKPSSPVTLASVSSLLATLR